MNSNRYAKFNDNVRSSGDLGLISFRKAVESDDVGIAELIFERDGEKSNHAFEYFLNRTQKELQGIDFASDYNMFVATYDNEIIAYGRSVFYDVLKNKFTYEAPTGWYLMGVLVREDYRRRGIAEKLTKMRIEAISMKANEVFYVVNAENKSSIRMHEKLGFKVISEEKGFLKVSFTGNRGYLCQKKL